MFNNIGAGELVIIAIVIMVLFGSKKLPEFTKALGESAKEFKKGYKDEDSGKKPESPPQA
jgi:sec-independent protein translocase protein TatA